MALSYPVPPRKISHGRGVSKTRRISRGLHSLSALWARVLMIYHWSNNREISSWTLGSESRNV